MFMNVGCAFKWNVTDAVKNLDRSNNIATRGTFFSGVRSFLLPWKTTHFEY